ncbi:MAG TPA: hypothetical protein VHE81_03830 [Lacipirellulaceae bacterium]|nr:hypothetical protein [Lacipirellulaceae bacterium]
MNQNSLTLLARLRQQLFRHKVDFVIFHRIFPHLEREAVHDYEFNTDAELRAATASLDVRALLDSIDAQVTHMPKAYGDAFRYIMHRDIQQRLTMYARLARRRLPTSQRIPRHAPECT